MTRELLRQSRPSLRTRLRQQDTQAFSFERRTSWQSILTTAGDLTLTVVP
jgi:hypothetical protein